MPANRVPQHNVLDLRAAARERERAPKRGSRLRQKFAAVRFPDQDLQQQRPTARPRDWLKLRRETSKFMLALGLVALPIAGVLGFVRFSRAADSVTARGQAGFIALREGAAALGQLQIESAKQHFDQAAVDLNQAAALLDDSVYHQAHVVSAVPFIGGRFTTATQLLAAGQRLTRAGEALANVADVSSGTPPGFSISSDGIVQGSIGALGPLLKKPEVFRSAVAEMVSAVRVLGDIQPEYLPRSYREQWKNWQALLPVISSSNNRLEQLTSVLLDIFASAEPKEYLVVFQNNDELRPTGGFMGTFLLVAFEGGTFKILDAPGNGPYALTSQIPHTALPPQPILSIAPYWTFHDANWFLDVPTSAEAMLNFYHQARGFKPDGIMFLTPDVVTELLKITGPLTVPSTHTTVTAETFIRQTEQQVEFQYDKAANAPKQMLIDLVPILLKAVSVLPSTDAVRAGAVLMQQADEQDILLYSREASTQQAITGLGWSGAIEKSGDDYLAVVDTNLGGGKTDLSITEDIDLHVLQQGALLRHEVTIRRQHNGTPNDPLSGQVNKDFLRVYAPSDANLIDIEGASVPDQSSWMHPTADEKLLPLVQQAEGRVLIDNATGIRITKESGLSVFGAWSILVPGETQTIKYIYTTPAKMDGDVLTWLLRWQKQPGASERNWHVTVEAQKGSHIVTTTPVSASAKNVSSVTFTADSQYSKTFGAVIQ